MPTSTSTRRARLRSIALGQGLQAARRDIVALSPHAPAVTRPSRDQALLEGRIALGQMRYLYEDDDALTGADGLQVTSLIVTEAAIRIEAGQRELARHIVDRDCDPFSTADIGLRVRNHAGLVEFHHVNRPGSVVLADFPYTDYVRLHAQRTDAHKPCIVTRSAHGLDEDEVACLAMYPHDDEPDMWAASSLLRRLGILTAPRPRSIDCWRGYGELKVECWYPDLTETAARRMLRDLSSVHLAPRWTLDRDRSSRSAIPGFHYFRIEGTESIVQLRILRA